MRRPLAVQELAAPIVGARAVTVLTGAGISTDSGIPDFRGPQGVWTRDPEAQRLSTLQEYVRDPEVRRRAWRGRRAHQAWAARPNEAHQALVDLERAGRLVAIVTQNIDGLHQRAGSAPEKVVEVHGTLFEAECLGCGRRTPMSDALDRVAAGDDDPACLVCGGIQKSATISFGQPLDPRVFAAARDAALACDLFLVVGSSLTVQPAASLCGLAVDNGAALVIVNAAPTPYDDLADAVIREPIGTALPALVPALIPGPG
jgi:NAD-dependent deacetylase